MAMERYVKALDQNDCHAAANGVGMVFARRGKPEIDCLASAVAAWHFISNSWAEMTDNERSLLARRSGNPEDLKRFIHTINEHITSLQQWIDQVKERAADITKSLRHHDLQLERLSHEKKEDPFFVE
eukprot:Skav200146  [mRNA]  locus=scaffold2013:287769:291626:- [translate_table: standard]